jgi:hypothetical protein
LASVGESNKKVHSTVYSTPCALEEVFLACRVLEEGGMAKVEDVMGMARLFLGCGGTDRNGVFL